MEERYTEIIKLYDYCLKIGVNARINSLYDGFKITFPNGGDFVQHQYSRCGSYGYVEPAISCRRDYWPLTVKQAKYLVKRHKDRLNRKDKRDET